MKRDPYWFRNRATTNDTGPRFDKLSKADWADVFCDLYRQCFGEQSDAETMLKDAERRVGILKLNRMR